MVQTWQGKWLYPFKGHTLTLRSVLHSLDNIFFIKFV